MTTFGFEAEFQVNVNPLVYALHRAGFSQATELHPYHCRCEDCDFQVGGVFRGQRDSSCGGEIISHVFTSDYWESALDAMAALERCAVDVDAIPGYDSGFHVHVQKPRTRAARAQAIAAYILWEPVLATIAQGRFPRVRDFNYPLGNAIPDIVANRYEAFAELLDESHDEATLLTAFSTGPDWSILPWLDPSMSERRRTAFFGTVLAYMPIYAGRHCWLSVETSSGNTWEFRLFNSTRVAWRMEMFCRTAVAFVTPDITSALCDVRSDDDITVQGFINRVYDHDRRLADLIDRQVRADKSNSPLSVPFPDLERPRETNPFDAVENFLRDNPDTASILRASLSTRPSDDPFAIPAG